MQQSFSAAIKESGRTKRVNGNKSYKRHRLSSQITLALYAVCLVAQSCPTLGTPWIVAHQAPLSIRILQARILEWVAMRSSRGSSKLRD